MKKGQYNKMTHQEFLEKLYASNERYRCGDFTIKEEYKSNKYKILLGTKYGDVRVQTNHLLSGLGFTIESAVDKTEFAKNKVLELFGEGFDFSKFEYTRSRDNVTLGCRIHGFFEIKYNNLMSPRGCPHCGKISLTEQVKNNGGWDYTRWRDKGLKSEYFDSFKVYVIRCWNGNEEFYKIGKTFDTVKGRMKGSNSSVALPYSWELIQEFILEDGIDICRLEVDLHNLHKEFKYTPKIKFSGYRECYSKIL